MAPPARPNPMTVKCPGCAAKTGQGCLINGIARTTQFHTIRWEAARRRVAVSDIELLNLYAALLDHWGRVRPGLTPNERKEMAARINALRKVREWAPLDMTGR